jgi:DNA repair protein RadD
MQLRDYQHRAIEAVYRYFEHSRGNPIVVAPTGAGKSVIIGALCRTILADFPSQRMLVLSHVKELIEQDFAKIKAFWPESPAGLYCASLGQRRARDAITVGSIQSVHRKAADLGWRDLIFIDECHLLSPNSETMYRKFIADMRQINPAVKIVGFTATPYRAKTGLLTEGEGRLFTDVCIEISLAELLDAGHIAPLISKPSLVQADMASVRITAGEFNAADMEREMDREELTRAALDEVFELAGDRKSWLVFCAGVAHSEHVRDAIRERGVSAETVTGDTPTDERDAILASLKDGRVRCVTNAQVLTTGFDAPNIDLIVLLRGTTSPGLYVQMLGRGMRTHPGKRNCLVLDYAGNIERHGPVTHVKPPRKAEKRGKKGSPSKTACLVCPRCRSAAPLDATQCDDCGHEFPERDRQVKHAAAASMLDVMPRDGIEVGEWIEVDAVRYARHAKEGKPDSMRVIYQCGLRRISEWVCLQHPPGYARRKAVEWWKKRSTAPVPETVGQALILSHTLPAPSRVKIMQNGQYTEVLDYEFDGPEAEAATADGGGKAA